MRLIGADLGLSTASQRASAGGTKRTCRPRCATSAFRGKAENICSHRAFPVLTQLRHRLIAFVAGCKPYSACDISDAEKHGSTPDRHSHLRGHFDRQPLTSTQKGASPYRA